MRPTDESTAPFSPVHHTIDDTSGNKSFLRPGTISIDNCAMLLRIHGGDRQGGIAIVPMISNCPDSNGNYPIIAPATLTMPVEIPANNGPATIVHNYGTYPIVQIIDTANGDVLDDDTTPLINHVDQNTVSIAFPPANAPMTVVMRV